MRPLLKVRERNRVSYARVSEWGGRRCTGSAKRIMVGEPIQSMRGTKTWAGEPVVLGQGQDENGDRKNWDWQAGNYWAECADEK